MLPYVGNVGFRPTATFTTEQEVLPSLFIGALEPLHAHVHRSWSSRPHPRHDNRLAKYPFTMNTKDSVQAHLDHATRLATQNVHSGGGPFGAVLVTADGREFEGINRVTANNDPTAHAEVTAIRTACAETNTFDLSGATLYSSCEPCPMCLSSALWARVESVYFAADRHDAANAGFDDAVFYDFFDAPDSERSMHVEQRASDEKTHLAPFTAWGALNTRIEY